jgi:CRISPR-associated protein Csx10
LRDSAKLIGCSDSEIERLFGKTGSSVSGSLKIGDARIEKYSERVKEIVSSSISHADVTDLFCSLRNQTALENDIAKEGSLRFTRVVNKFSPFDNGEMAFYAEMSFDDDDYQLVLKLCKALRNIGYHRNRGLGSVVCSVEDFASDNNAELIINSINDAACYRIEYCVLLKNDIMLPAYDANRTGDYISGVSVLGAFASKYKGNNFEDLFLSGKVRFGNLYVSDSEGNDYFPVPGFLGKIKIATTEEDKGVKNLIKHRGDTTKIYKPLKNGFVNAKVGLAKPKMKITYHKRENVWRK